MSKPGVFCVQDVENIVGYGGCKDAIEVYEGFDDTGAELPCSMGGLGSEHGAYRRPCVFAAGCPTT